MSYNPYQKMHYDSLRSSGPRKTSYCLYYGNQLILQDKSYPLCRAKQNELKKTGNYNLQLFKIK